MSSLSTSPGCGMVPPAAASHSSRCAGPVEPRTSEPLQRSAEPLKRNRQPLQRGRQPLQRNREPLQSDREADNAVGNRCNVADTGLGSKRKPMKKPVTENDCQPRWNDG